MLFSSLNKFFKFLSYASKNFNYYYFNKFITKFWFGSLFYRIGFSIRPQNWFFFSGAYSLFVSFRDMIIRKIWLFRPVSSTMDTIFLYNKLYYQKILMVLMIYLDFYLQVIPWEKFLMSMNCSDKNGKSFPLGLIAQMIRKWAPFLI